MKKTLSLLLVLLMVVTIIPFALAEDNETASEDQTSDQEDISDDLNETEAGDSDVNESIDEEQIGDSDANESVEQENETGDSDENATSEEDTQTEPVETGEADTEEETQSQVESMGTGIGAQVRLLQLEKAIERNILRGQEVIKTVKAKGNDTSALDAIISDMEDLKIRVQALDPASENSVSEFVAIKKEAIDLSNQFKTEARTLLKKSDADALKEKLKKIDRKEIKDISTEIKSKVKEYNYEQIAKTFEILGIENADLLTKFSEGTATLKEVKDAIKAEFKSMTKEEKKTSYSALKEAGVKKTVSAKAVIEKVKEKVNEKLQKKNETKSEDSGNEDSGQEGKGNSADENKGDEE